MKFVILIMGQHQYWRGPFATAEEAQEWVEYYAVSGYKAVVARML